MSEHLVVDPRQAIRWAYNFLLGREPESDAAIDNHLKRANGYSLQVIRQTIMGSAEFQAAVQATTAGPRQTPAISQFLSDFLDDKAMARAGFFTDRFGVRTRVSYLPGFYQAFSGKVGARDGSGDMPVHDAVEMNALLQSVATAEREFTIAELGAGWGPWLVLGAHLARRRGMPARMIGVEGSSDHVEFMRTHMADNGFDPATQTIVHAVVGTYDGVAYFPKLADPSGNWGAEASFAGQEVEGDHMEKVACVSIAHILQGCPRVDLLHCDIQGAEADVFTTAIHTLNQTVRRTCIGTHGRSIEVQLMSLMSENGWQLEAEKPCELRQDGPKFILIADGVQVWRNPREI